MAKVQIFWDPAGFELDALGTNKFSRITDGDTPYLVGFRKNIVYQKTVRTS